MSDNANHSPGSKPVFDPTINYGHVLTVVSFMLAGAGAYYGMRAELQSVDLRVAKIENTLQQLANVLVLTARQDERLIAIERRVVLMHKNTPRRFDVDDSAPLLLSDVSG